VQAWRDFRLDRSVSVGVRLFRSLSCGLTDQSRKSHDQTLKVRDAIKLVERDGWLLVNFEGSHRQYKHPTKKGRVTVAGHPSMDLDPKTRNSILKQAGLK
jgi:predicted RNA binding protein YcfA (HicA-like mRNA interferase family)